MANTPKQITITPSQGLDGKIQWAMSYDGKGYTPGDYPKIALDHDSGSHQFQFAIAPNSWNITFKNGKGLDSPIFIQELQGTNPNDKPTPGVVNNQIEAIVVQKNGTELQFVDRNHGGHKTLTYQLNFNGEVSPLDPIIENGGGGGHFYDWIRDYPIASAAVALLALALLAAFIRQRRQRTAGGPTGGR